MLNLESNCGNVPPNRTVPTETRASIKREGHMPNNSTLRRRRTRAKSNSTVAPHPYPPELPPNQPLLARTGKRREEGGGGRRKPTGDVTGGEARVGGEGGRAGEAGAEGPEAEQRGEAEDEQPRDGEEGRPQQRVGARPRSPEEGGAAARGGVGPPPLRSAPRRVYGTWCSQGEAMARGWFAGGGGGGGGERRGGGRSSASWSSLRAVIKRRRGEERWNIRLRLPGEKDLRTTGLRPGNTSHLVQLLPSF